MEVLIETLNLQNEIVLEKYIVENLEDAIKHLGSWENEYGRLESWQQELLENT